MTGRSVGATVPGMGQRLENARSLYLEAIRDGDYAAAIEAYAGDRYVQHSTPVEDGKEGFTRFFAAFVERNPVRDIEIVRSFEDGPYVFLHVVQRLNHSEFVYVTADIFDTDDDARLVEHWDVVAEMGGPNRSGRTAVDGPTEPRDLDRTEESKRLVTRYVHEVLVAGQHDRIADLVAPGLARHGPDATDGADSLREDLAVAGVRYHEVHRVIGCGDLVAVLAESEVRGVRYAVIDLFRVEDGRVAEHWEVAEPITPEETWVNSGKF